ncbi:unknown [Halorubrum sp. DM2]|uniref:hypothetical protein n=1 Tax=Halorubrum sp. DM2 TaxID=2527867 RepID=UPI0024B69641|nr:hypothetical protein [Halorubrum sp. DM2]VTT85230.1 unknown [Halorubrum sp. DM2]
MDHTRRDALAGSALALSVAAAGCLDFAAGEGPQGPEGTPATLTCENENFVRLDQPFEGDVEETVVEAGETTFELSSEGNSETYGQSLRLVLRNTGDGPATALGRHAYSIQRETETGWIEIRGSTTGETVELPRSEETLDSSGVYNWSIDLDEQAIASAVPDVELTVCPELGPGTYRFVYWGLVDGPPIGVEFELVG